MYWLIIAFCDPAGDACIIHSKTQHVTEFDCAEAAEEVDYDFEYRALVEELATDIPVYGEWRDYCFTEETLKELDIDVPVD